MITACTGSLCEIREKCERFKRKDTAKDVQDFSPERKKTYFCYRFVYLIFNKKF